jgi:hypothetical protein
MNRARLRPALAVLFAATATLAGCDLLGIEPASAVAARKETDGKAVGAACRHAGRALEDCYALNKKADRGSVFAGWREMNDYMRENKIDEVAPQALAALAAPASSAKENKETSGSKEADEPAPKSGAKKP